MPVYGEGTLRRGLAWRCKDQCAPRQLRPDSISSRDEQTDLKLWLLCCVRCRWPVSTWRDFPHIAQQSRRIGQHPGWALLHMAATDSSGRVFPALQGRLLCRWWSSCTRALLACAYASGRSETAG